MEKKNNDVKREINLKNLKYVKKKLILINVNYMEKRY